MKISLCSRIKDAENIVCEWIAHYVSLGFDKLFIYDNMSSPAIETIVSQKIPHLLPYVKIILDDVAESYQTNRFNECLEKYGSDYDWMFFCDDDEFLHLRSDLSLKDYLHQIPANVGTILINWVVYGHNKLEKFDDTKLAIEQFVYRETYDNFWCRFVKSFVKPSIVKEVQNVHYSINKNALTIDGNGTIIDVNHVDSSVCELANYKLDDATKLVLSHYMTRDKETMEKKRIKNEKAKIYFNRLTEAWYAEYFKDNVLDTSMSEKYAEKIRQLISL
uniref:Glycosyltransferase 2-like domain-containing protein n=1 Tax=viral metagenome TaxID=1070528 RepID=A0A6C0KSA3_9ZZZZ